MMPRPFVPLVQPVGGYVEDLVGNVLSVCCMDLTLFTTFQTMALLWMRTPQLYASRQSNCTYSWRHVGGKSHQTQKFYKN